MKGTRYILEALAADILKSDWNSIPHPYSLILDTIDVVLKFQPLPDNLQKQMITLYGVQGVLEIVTLCGFYQMIGEITQAFDVPLPDGAVKPF